MDLYFVRIFRLFAHIFQRDQVIPDGNMPVVFTALYSIPIEPLDPDGMHAKGNKAKQSETIGGGCSLLPG